jgi:hypothetical protein
MIALDRIYIFRAIDKKIIAMRILSSLPRGARGL